ncbi:hypothetical protein BKA70DRAFT_1103618 [Coprinopsis sp. MPI-PUGE-AT-0042]|nr:hypothetical protein BKA70DRAFT_1103618 [Coprinopsis sp. MPI-PUGE-AT-0042]
MREEFNRELCCLLVACNIAWWAVENRYWRYFFSKWVRGCIVPGRKQISGRVLDGEADRVVEAMKAKVNGRYATGQCDGWKNIAKTSLVASMINVEYTPHLLGVADISAQSKTAENLLEIVLKEIKYCREILMVKLVAWCTDASGESLKMRKLLRTKFPWIVTIDCWAHQVSTTVTGNGAAHVKQS